MCSRRVFLRVSFFCAQFYQLCHFVLFILSFFICLTMSDFLVCWNSISSLYISTNFCFGLVSRHISHLLERFKHEETRKFNIAFPISFLTTIFHFFWGWQVATQLSAQRLSVCVCRYRLFICIVLSLSLSLSLHFFVFFTTTFDNIIFVLLVFFC